MVDNFIGIFKYACCYRTFGQCSISDSTYYADNNFPTPDEKGMMNDNWYGHQFATTTNFSPNSKFLFWLIGGLNYQVEHHVLPDVCHVHYKKLTNIVADTAREFGMPYHVKKYVLHALVDHTKMLRILGKKQVLTL